MKFHFSTQDHVPHLMGTATQVWPRVSLDKDSLTARPRGASEALKTTTLMEKGRGEKNLRPFQGFCLGPRQPQELSQTRAKGGGFSGGSAAMMETVV